MNPAATSKLSPDIEKSDLDGDKAKPDRKTAQRQRAARLSPEARRSQLLESAIKVFAREGISHANHTQIALEADVSLPAVFAYFPTHDDLTHAVLDYVSVFMLEQLVIPTQSGNESAQEHVERTLIGFADLIDTHRDITRVWLDWSTAVRGKNWPRYLEHHEKVCKVFEATINRGKKLGEVAPEVNTEDAAWVLIGLGHMIAHMKFAGHSNARIRGAVDDLILSYFLGPRATRKIR